MMHQVVRRPCCRHLTHVCSILRETEEIGLELTAVYWL